MGCNCKWTEIIIALVIIVFTWWRVAYWEWIVTIAAVLLIIHALKCKNCGMCDVHAGMKSGSKASAAPKKKAVKKKKRR